MKIAIIGPRGVGYPAGIDHYVTELARRLADKGHEITVFCQSGYGRKNEDYPSIRQVMIPTIKNKYLGTPVYAFAATMYAATHKFDIIHYHGLGSAVYSIIPRILGKKTVVTVHALDWEGRKWGFFSRKTLQFAAWAAAKFPHRTTVVSRTVQEYFQKHYRCDALYVPNGAEMLPARAPDLIKKYGLGKENYILFLGRLAPGKGCEYLIDAYNGLGTDLRLVIAGDAIHEHDYVRWLKGLAGKNVIFSGWVQGRLKEELLSNAYLFVQPSELEGMSGVLLEAMGYGRCVIASDIAQNIEVLGDAGLFFRNKDKKDLRRSIEAAIPQKELIGLLGEKARQRVLGNFEWDKISDKWEDLYLYVKPK